MNIPESQYHRTYDTAVCLMLIADMICPQWLQAEMQDMLNRCWEALPAKLEFTLLPDDEF